MRSNNLSEKKQLTVFTHWTRKSYAVFNSLKRTIKIGVLVTPVGLLVQPAHSQTKQDTTKVSMQIEMDGVEVTAENTAFVYSQQSRIVTIIPKSEICQLPAKNLEEAIEMAAGMDLRSRGSGVQSDLSFRGGSFEQTQILIDGVNVSDPQSGHYSLNLPIDLISIERIEILHGSGARIFGANAFAATINVITSKPEETALILRARYGEFQLIEMGAIANLKGKKLNQGISLERASSSGFHPNTDYLSQSISYRNQFNINRLRFNNTISLQDKSFGANKFYSAKYDEQYDDNQSGFIHLSMDYLSENTSRAHSADAYYRMHNDHYVLIRSNPKAYQNYHLNQTIGFRYKWKSEWKYGVSSIGSEYRREAILSTNLGLPIDSVQVPMQDSAWFTKADQRNHFSIYLDHNYSYQNFSVSFGGLFHYLPENELIGLYPGIDLSIKTRLGVFMASASKTMRLPSFTELYYQAPDLIGNPDLLPEEAISLEISHRFKIKSLQTRMSAFQRIGNGLIDWIWLEDQQKWHTVNFTDSRFYGIEAGITWKPAEIKWISQLNLDITAMNSNNPEKEFETRYVNDFLSKQASLKLIHPIYKGFGIGWQASYQDREGTYLLYQKESNSYQLNDYQPQIRIDARIYYRVKKFDIQLDIRNITNDQQFDLGSVPQPGRWVSIGLQWKLI